MKKIIIIALMLTSALQHLTAQENRKKELLYSNRFTILAGLIQPLVLEGGNFEVNYTTKRMIFEFSHGYSLDPVATKEMKDQKIVMHLPYSTGFGIGYRINSFLDIRFEPKLHSWEVYYKDDSQDSKNRIADFKTFTLGAGLYYRYFPFKNSDNKFLQGITTSSSIRWWQNVGTTLKNDELMYANAKTEKNERLKAPNIGISNSPLIVNVGVGFTIGGK